MKIWSVKEEDFKILKDLTEIQSCSGNESKIREYIKEKVEKYWRKIYRRLTNEIMRSKVTDRLGVKIQNV